MIPYLLIFGGWALAAILSWVLGPRTNFSLSALVFVLGVGTACNVAAVVIA